MQRALSFSSGGQIQALHFESLSLLTPVVAVEARFTEVWHFGHRSAAKWIAGHATRLCDTH